MTKLFVSYTTRDNRDRALARRLHDDLSTRGVEVFLAERAIPPGEQWHPRLVHEIDSACTHFLVIVSAASDDAEWVEFEIAQARQRRSRDANFCILTLLTGSVENPFPDLQSLSYADEYREQVEIVAEALGLPRRNDYERVFEPVALWGRSSAGAGPLAPHLCDRRDQEKRFRSAFDTTARKAKLAPQVYFIVGDEREKHESLVERFRHTFLTRYAEFLKPIGSAKPARHVVDWPDSTTAAEAELELLASLFAEFEPSYRYDGALPLTADAFHDLTRARPDAVVVLQHALYGTHWHRELPDLIQRYIRFWDLVAAKGPTAQFLIFMNVFLPQDDADSAEALLGTVQRLATRRAETRETNDPLCVAASVLPPLKCVRRDDVEEWFDQRLPDCSWERRSKVCEELFRDGDCRPMAEVERRLRDIYQTRAGGAS
jgi:hypothetical protein